MTTVAIEPRAGRRRGRQPAQVRRGGHSETIEVLSPWTASQVTWCLAVAVIGIVGQVVCWYGASGEVTLRSQLPWVGGAVIFAAVCAGAGGIWLCVGLVTMRRAHREVLVATRTLFGIAQPAVGPTLRTEDIRATPADTEFVTAPNMTMLHRPNCLAARGKQVEPISAAAAARAGLSSCGICAS